MRTDYPILASNPSIQDIANWLNRISQLRSVEDLADYFNQKNIYLSGRSTTRVPTNADDVQSGDRLGDQVYATDGSYVYNLIDIGGGVLKWGRTAIETVW
jgi:hypothetical protein